MATGWTGDECFGQVAMLNVDFILVFETPVRKRDVIDHILFGLLELLECSIVLRSTFGSWFVIHVVARKSYL